MRNRKWTDHTCWEHPEGNHGGEVEGRDAGADPDGGPEAGEVHVLGDTGQRLAQHQVRVGAKVLNYLHGTKMKKKNRLKTINSRKYIIHPSKCENILSITCRIHID